MSFFGTLALNNINILSSNIVICIAVYNNIKFLNMKLIYFTISFLSVVSVAIKIYA